MRVPEYLGHIRQAATDACTFVEGQRKEGFLADRLTQQAVILSLLIFNTYGPRMHPNDGRVVSNFIVQARRGLRIPIFLRGPISEPGSCGKSSSGA